MDQGNRVFKKGRIIGNQSCIPNNFQGADEGQPCDGWADCCTNEGGPVLPPTLDIPPERARELYDLSPVIAATLRRAGVPPCDTPDVVQSVLIDIIKTSKRKAAQGAEPWVQDLRGYVRGAARRAAAGYHRERAARIDVLSSEFQEAVEAWEGDPQDAENAPEVAIDMDLELLCQCTSPANWRAFYGNKVLGVLVVDIAEAENVPTGTIHNRLRIARADLAAAVRRLRAADRNSR
jgi:DNA-directed RNA polymerase specialized sigma24 family protein